MSKAIYRTDIQVVTCYYLRYLMNLRSRQAAPQHGDDVAGIVLVDGPFEVFFPGERSELDGKPQLITLHQDVLEQGSGLCILAHFKNNGQIERLMDVRLADIEDGYVVLSQNTGQTTGQSRTVGSGNRKKDDLFLLFFSLFHLACRVSENTR